MLDALTSLGGGFATALTPQNLLLALIGVTLGTLVGVLPGLGPSATLAILLPITFGLPPEGTLIMMAGLYYGAKYGGSTTAILLNIPGESASVMTTIDGYALAKQGRAGPALGIAAISSFIAGTIGVIGLTFLAPVVADFAIGFGPPEFFGLMIFGLTTIVLLAGDSVLKGLLSTALGLLLATVGADIVSGQSRFVFGQIELLDGIDFIIVAIGVFAVAEVLANVETTSTAQLFTVPRKLRELLPTMQDIKDCRIAFAQSSVIGFFIGVLPGAGSTIASFISYGVQHAGTESWAIVREDAVHLVDGQPFGSFHETGDVVPLDAVQLLAPVSPSKILCVGRNYEAHRKEMGMVELGTPSIFMKPPNAVVGPGQDVVLPPVWLSTKVEHEGELAVVIGRPARFVSPEDALQYVLGFTCADDVSARDLQKSDPQPTRGKGFDTFCPVGPWLETELDLAAGVMVRCRVNGQLRQEGSTLDMTYDVPYLVSFLSQFTTLLPGDVVLTGSPGGTGPLVPGDEVEVDIEGIGVLRHQVIADSHSQDPGLPVAPGTSTTVTPR